MSDSLLDRMFPDGSRPRTPMPQKDSFSNHPENWHAKGASVTEEVCTRWAAMCTLELQGYTKTEIAAKMGLTLQGVSTATRNPRYIEHRDKRLAEIDDEFITMKPLAIAALRGGLTSNDENTALRASEQWFKAASFGGYSKTEAPATHLTAEDVARQLLGVQVNVTVNNVSEPNNHPDSTIADESVG